MSVELLAFQLQALKIPFRRESRFHDTRKWRFDFAFLDNKLAVEVEGILYQSAGRHQRGAGFQNDLDKYDAAMQLGWNVYRCSPKMVKSGHALKTIEVLLEL